MPESNQPSFAKKFRPYFILIVVSVIVLWKFGGRFKEIYFPAADTTPSTTSKTRHIGNHEVLDNCQWVENEKNDGDSFLVKHGNSEYTFKAYFVDAPAISLGGKNQNELAEQGEYFGGLSPDQTVKIGVKAKVFTEEQLKGKSFTILTRWENVPHNDHYYAFVWLPGSTEDRPIQLSDELLKKGLARIYIREKGSRNGGNFSQFEDPQKRRDQQRGLMQRLRKMENQAKQAGLGAWGIKNSGGQ